MDWEMDNQTLNRTFMICSESYSIVCLVLNNVQLFFDFPSTVVVIIKLLSKIYKTRRVSPAESFLLQINFTNVCLSSSLLLLFLKTINVAHFYSDLYLFFQIPSITARPFFLLAIAAIFYMAIVHPITYMATKSCLRWDWLVITLIWIYTLAIAVFIFLKKLDLFHPFFFILFFINFPPTIFFNIATLRALSSSGPGNGSQNLNLAKRKAFRIILSILMVLLVYYVPRLYVNLYAVIAPNDWNFLCYEVMIMLIPKFSEIAMPVIFLYSLRRLGV